MATKTVTKTKRNSIELCPLGTHPIDHSHLTVQIFINGELAGIRAMSKEEYNLFLERKTKITIHEIKHTI